MPALRNPVHESMCRDVAGGMSEHAAWTAAGFGSRNSTRFFKRPKVATRVAELREEFNRGAEIQLQYLQEKLLGVVNADIGQFVEKVPYSSRLRLKDVTAMAPEQRRAISELVIEKNGRTSIKLESKAHAIDSLLKTIGGFAPSQVEVSGPNGGPVEIELRTFPPLERWRRTVFVVEATLRSFDGLPEFRQMLANSLRDIADGNQAIEVATPLQRAKAAMLRLYGEIQELVSDHEACDFLANYLTVTAQRIALPAQQGRGG